MRAMPHTETGRTLLAALVRRELFERDLTVSAFAERAKVSRWTVQRLLQPTSVGPRTYRHVAFALDWPRELVDAVLSMDYPRIARATSNRPDLADEILRQLGD